MRGDPGSILQLYRRLLAERRASGALRLGAFAWLPAPEGVLAWRRDAPGDARAAVVNFTASPREVPLAGGWTVRVASDGRGEGERWAARVGPDQAVVLG